MGAHSIARFDNFLLSKAFGCVDIADKASTVKSTLFGL